MLLQLTPCCAVADGAVACGGSCVVFVCVKPRKCAALYVVSLWRTVCVCVRACMHAYVCKHTWMFVCVCVCACACAQSCLAYYLNSMNTTLVVSPSITYVHSYPSVMEAPLVCLRRCLISLAIVVHSCDVAVAVLCTPGVSVFVLARHG